MRGQRPEAPSLRMKTRASIVLCKMDCRVKPCNVNYIASVFATRFAFFRSRFQNTRFQSRKCFHHCGAGPGVPRAFACRVIRYAKAKRLKGKANAKFRNTAHPALQRTRAMALDCLKFESVRGGDRASYPSPCRGRIKEAERDKRGAF